MNRYVYLLEVLPDSVVEHPCRPLSKTPTRNTVHTMCADRESPAVIIQRF